jgi:tetratricopeptide (TPR) repeat protein
MDLPLHPRIPLLNPTRTPPGPDPTDGRIRPQRVFSRLERHRKEPNQGNRQVLRVALGYSPAGFILGAAAGFYTTQVGGLPSSAIWVGGIIGWLVTITTPLLITSAAGRFARRLYFPSGRSTPPQKQHSLAESLAVRGQYEEALKEFERALADDPADPDPYLRIARLHRDHTKRYELAAQWFRKATREAKLAPSLELLVRHELVELYNVNLEMPQRAAPELAMIVERFAGTADGDRAAAELAELKASLESDEGGGT